MIFSATQVETFRDCPRKWYLTYVKGLRTPPAPSAQLGTRVHSVLEAWLRDGTEPVGCDLFEYQDKRGNTIRKFPGRIAMNGLHLLPPPRTCKVEGSFQMQTPGASWRGVRDAVHAMAHAPAALPEVTLYDHKTTSNPIWAKDEAELLADVQGNLYAYDLMQAHGVAKIEAQWTYFLTDEKPSKPQPDAPVEHKAKWLTWLDAKKPLAWAVQVTYYLHDVLDVIAGLDKDAARMTALRESGLDAGEVPAVHANSDKYGGCPHRNVACVRTLESIYGADEAQKDRLVGIEDLLKRQQAKKAATQAEPPPPPVTPWLPGDDLGPAQEQMVSAKKPLWVVAAAAAIAPPNDVAQTWPGANLPYPADPDAQAEHPAVKARLAGVDLLATGTPPGVEERGTINPELPPPPPPREEAPPPPPAAAGELDRDLLKDECVRLGLCTTSSRLGAPALKKLLDEANRTHEGAPPPPVADAPAPVEAFSDGKPALSDTFADLLADKLFDRLVARFVRGAASNG